jgi:hypothetical protein
MKTRARDPAQPPWAVQVRVAPASDGNDARKKAKSRERRTVRGASRGSAPLAKLDFVQVAAWHEIPLAQVCRDFEQRVLDAGLPLGTSIRHRPSRDPLSPPVQPVCDDEVIAEEFAVFAG